jgi:hypothetical protein
MGQRVAVDAAGPARAGPVDICHRDVDIRQIRDCAAGVV